MFNPLFPNDLAVIFCQITAVPGSEEDAAVRLHAKGSRQAQGEIPIKEIHSSFGLTFLYRSVQVRSATSCQDGQTRLEPSMGSVATYPEMICGIESG